MFKWGQDANVISVFRVTRSPGKKMKASTWFNISDTLFYILETTNSSTVGRLGRLPRGFKTFGMMPNAWLSLIKIASKTNFDNSRSPSP